MNSEEDQYKAFQCKICLDMATEPVTTPCGHLYCWQCLYKWAEKKTPLTCPYCYNHFDLDKCTSIFAGESKTRTNIPKRPQNKRNEPPPQQQHQNQFNIGFGFGFPFMMFSNIDLGNMNYRQIIPIFIFLFGGYILNFIANLGMSISSHSKISEFVYGLILMFGVFKLLTVGAARLLY